MERSIHNWDSMVVPSGLDTGHYMALYRERGVEYAFKAAVDDAVKLLAYARACYGAALLAAGVMKNGFIAPEDCSEEFERGWMAACAEFANSASRQMLEELVDGSTAWLKSCLRK